MIEINLMRKELISEFVVDLNKSKGMRVHQLLNWRDRLVKKWEEKLK